MVSIVTINMKIGAVTSSQSPFGSRYGFAVTGNSTDRVFVIGGYNRQADEYFSDIWQYEVFTNNRAHDLWQQSIEQYIKF